MCLCNLVPKGKGENSQQRFSLSRSFDILILVAGTDGKRRRYWDLYSVTMGSVNKLEWYN